MLPTRRSCDAANAFSASSKIGYSFLISEDGRESCETARVHHRASAHRAGSAGKMTRDVTITWLGSAAFRLQSVEGKSIYLDPWLQNSDCPASERAPIA